jgi:hypothetical protein
MDEERPVGNTTTGDVAANKSSKHAAYFEDHRALQVVLGRVESTRDLNLLIPLLEELYRLLQGHFAREESEDGLQGVIEKAAPHQLGHLEALLNEHGGFLVTTRSVKEKIQACVSGPMAEIYSEVQVLCDRLQTHEEAETTLLTEALYTDLGESG